MSNQHATTFRRLHQGTTPLLLPNAWDAASASLFEHAGAAAIATTSAGMAWALGYRDGGLVPPDAVVGAAARMARVLGVPLSIDIENGYSDDPQAVASLVRRLADIGVAGINIEDGSDDPALLVAKIGAIRDSLARSGADLFVNARCDVFLAGLAAAPQQAAETIRRGQRYADAGADGLFVPGLAEMADIAAVADGVALPLNVMAWPGLPGVAALAQAGVRRFSAGSSLPQVAWGVAEQAARAFLATGGSAPPLQVVARPFGDMQALFPAA